MKMAAAVTGLIGVLILAVGLILGYSGVHQDGINCGSAFGGSSNAAMTADLERAMQADQFGTADTDLSAVEHDCSDARSTRSTLTWVLMIPGVVLVVVALGLGVAQSNRKPPAVPA